MLIPMQFSASGVSGIMKYSRDFIARYIAATCLSKIKGLEDEIEALWEAVSDLQDEDVILHTLIDALNLDVDSINAAIRLIQAQLNGITFLSLTLEEYNELAVHALSTLYIVTDTTDNSVNLYWGDTLISGGTSTDVWATIRQIQLDITNIQAALGNVKLLPLTLTAYNALAQKDSSTLYIVTDTSDDSVSLYWGDTLISGGGGGGGSEYEARIAALENQVTGYTGLTQNPKVNLRWYTRAQYEAITHSNDTLYVVQNLDSSMQVYIGNTVLNNGGNGAGIIIGVFSLIYDILSYNPLFNDIIMAVVTISPI